ncbi:hypothetical protein ACEOHI_000866 [Vibrio parahaemolyticus]
MMKTMTLDQTHQLLNNLQLLNVCSHQFEEVTAELSKDDPLRIAATSIFEGAEDFKGLEMHVNEEDFEKAQELFSQLVSLQAAVEARTLPH